MAAKVLNFLDSRVGLVTGVLFIVLSLCISVIYSSNTHAAEGTHTITYINNGSSTTKTYPVGSTITLDALPAGAIAWCDDNDPNVPNGKMAYVNYDNQIASLS